MKYYSALGRNELSHTGRHGGTLNAVRCERSQSGKATHYVCVHVCVCVCVLSLAWICGPMDCSLLGFCGLPFPPPGDLSNPEIKPESCVSCMGRLILYHCAAREARSVQLRLYKILEKAKLWRQ